MKKYLFYLMTLILITACRENNQLSEKKDVRGEFVKLSANATGIDFENKLPLDNRINILTYEYFYNGGGVAIGDINNDDLPDLYFTANLGSNKLYLNKGNLQFEDITVEAGVTGEAGWSTGTTMVDINHDGLLDIYVCRSGRFDDEKRRNQLFINNGDQTFTEKAAEYGLDDAGFSTQALFFDFDRDGDLDMYLLNHAIKTFEGKYIEAWLETRDDHVGDKLFENKDGFFRDISERAGINQNKLGYGLGVAAGDVNNDGWPDLYIGNDYIEHDYLYINQKDGTFKEAVHEAIPHTSNFSMGVDISDINNDGLQDIMVLDMVAEDNYRQKTNMASMNPAQFYQAVEYGFHYQYMFNTLQLNRGQTRFSDIAQLAGISNTDWSWAVLAEDLDNDGWKDIFITNGFRKEFGNKDFVNYRKKKTSEFKQEQKNPIQLIENLLDTLQDGRLGNYVFKNNRDLTFSKMNKDWKLEALTYSNGASIADLDLDGDLDLVINNIDQKASIYENQLSANNSLMIKFKGQPKNLFGIGTTVEIWGDGLDKQYKSNFLTRGYQSSVPPVFTFGLSGQTTVDTLLVTWPDGKKQLMYNVAANQVLTLEYNHADKVNANIKSTNPIFSNISFQTISYTHAENEFNDFLYEVLLPHRMSRFGPALAVGDINGDGFDDVYLGGATGYNGQLFVQSADGKLKKSSNGLPATHSIYEDVDATFFDADQDGDLDLYVVSGGNEFELGEPELMDRIYINDGMGNFSYDESRLPGSYHSGSVVRPYDFDKDGDIDVFVGSKFIPRKYPLPASSQLLLNDGNGYFTNVTNQLASELLNIGMINDMQWTDYDQDGD
ncbi:MAG: VCBS repeat-containing protein, partial [Fulvivirga sp.]|nr:VCBS repeat-containing protein [Fulvivirga sp.]